MMRDGNPLNGALLVIRIVTIGLAALAAALGCLGFPVVDGSDYTPERFLAECKVGLAKLEERANHCHGRYRLIEGGASLGWQNIYDVEFATSDDQMLLQTHHKLRKERGKPDIVYDRREVRAGNPHYSFHITMGKGTDQYRLDEHELASDAPTPPPGGKIRNRITGWMSPPLATHWMGFFALRPLLDHPTFRVVKLTDRVRDGVKVVRAEFTARPGEPKTDPRVSWTRDRVFGWFEVAPTEGWTVRAYEYTYFAAGATPSVPLAKSREIGEVGYAPGPDGLPVVSRYKQATAWLEMAPDGYIEIDQVDLEFGPTPAEHFRLSHYGLPEPVGVPPLPKPRGHMYWWFLAAAVGFAALGLAFRRLARRKAARPTPPPGV